MLRRHVSKALGYEHLIRVPINGPHRLKSTSSRTQKSETRTQKTQTKTSPAAAPTTESWLTRKIETSPSARFWFERLTTLLGYNSPKQIAGRRALVLYDSLCVGTAGANQDFWRHKCDLPPTFQSWFTITHLHVWMLTVRLRALPPPHGKYYVQFVLDHFFLDIEDRIRAILQPSVPPRAPYTTPSTFYVNPNLPPEGETLKRGSRAPERLVTRQLKVFREQWMGMGMSFDLGLVKSDAELAAAVWRNLLGARGARGIDYSVGSFRRAVNLVGGNVEDPEKVDFEKEEVRDDGSGVHDYGPGEVDKYVMYPELMEELVTYIRRELVRLEGISDSEIMDGYISAVMKFGSLR
ncbi:hypothetical protein E1B28_003199 [Marasmius oreades]|uniref:Ubiquinol-cytochrome c chaperone domain-containing protein n=1 Tax=Marasmius oreades TaxID=181124 RepID=A0A9P7UK87_9AGAR|nr:uncharacterized protein E1B28_003199 [Marasmius oreades]KAG7085653.1 hypothetical protein E1B28_003199 [Marasmius oreades]